MEARNSRLAREQRERDENAAAAAAAAAHDDCSTIVSFQRWNYKSIGFVRSSDALGGFRRL